MVSPGPETDESPLRNGNRRSSLLDFLEPELRDPAGALGGSLDRCVMVHDDPPVRSAAQVHLEDVDSELERPLECEKRVLRPESAPALVRDRERSLAEKESVLLRLRARMDEREVDVER